MKDSRYRIKIENPSHTVKLPNKKNPYDLSGREKAGMWIESEMRYRPKIVDRNCR
jgi:hypothetical protein